MKKIIGVLALYATLGLFAAPFANVFELKAQTTAPAAAAQGTCTDEAKSAWYADFTKFRTSNPTQAYEAAKKYLGACPTEEGQIPAYLKKWVVAYDKEARKIKMADLFVNQRKYAEASAVAKEVLTDEPDNILAHITQGYGGYVVAVTTKNESGNADAITHAKKAIQLIESGKTLENWAPFKSKDDALGYLYYSVGFLQRATNATEALNHFIKSAQFESDIKKNPQTYAFIAAAYENEYAKQSNDYQAKYANKDETPESKLAVENINQIVDRVIDALARAVSVAGTDANAQASKTQWMGRLTELYKFRNKSEAGLNEMIAGVMSKPLPPVPTPITVLPTAPATSTNPTSGTPNAGNGSAAAVPVNKPATVPGAASALTTTPKTTAATSTTGAKPKPKNNHVTPKPRRR